MNSLRSDNVIKKTVSNRLLRRPVRFFVFLSLFWIPSLQAANLTAPHLLEDTATLPQGVRNPRFQALFLSIEDRFNGTGSPEPLGSPLSRTVTWKDVLSAQPADKQAELKATLTQLGLSEEEGGPGFTTGEIRTQVQVLLPILGIGLTDTLTFAAAIPIYSVGVGVSTGFVGTAEGQQFVDSLYSSSSPALAEDVAAQLNSAVSRKAQAMGYQPLEDRSSTHLGDIRLLAKWKFFEVENHTLALKPSLTLPTGQAPNADQLIDVPTGDGQTDLGLQLTSSWNFAPRFTWSQFIGYTYQTPDQHTMRIPLKAGERLSPDKESVSRKLGDLLQAGTSVAWGSTNGLIQLGVGYTFQYQWGARFQGKAYQAERYEYLNDLNPSQMLHSGTLTAGLSTVSWFKNHSFPVPFQTFVSYSHPFAGRNAPASDVIAGELVLFF